MKSSLHKFTCLLNFLRYPPTITMPASKRRAAEPVHAKKANSTKAAAKAAAPAKTAEQIAQEEHDALVTAASKLIQAVTYSPLAEVKRLLKEGSPTWYQEESMGWNCLHFAAERGDADIVKACLGAGAVWNAGRNQDPSICPRAKALSCS